MTYAVEVQSKNFVSSLGARLPKPHGVVHERENRVEFKSGCRSVTMYTARSLSLQTNDMGHIDVVDINVGLGLLAHRHLCA